jgi:NADPH:quinone reductase-like Zn-dependent oxidoreductase
MRAVTVTAHGGPGVLVVREQPDPVVRAGHVLIAVRAAGVNFADLLARCGRYPDAPRPPCVLGYEVAGEVAAVGEGIKTVSVGDRVIAATRFGGQAELVSVPAGHVVGLPDGVSFQQGAAVLVSYATAYAALIVLGGLRAGERALIHGAGGGVGLAACQLGRRFGAEVIGTAATFKHDAIRANGVAYAIDSRAGDLRRGVLQATGGEGVDVAIDSFGPRSFRASYQLLRPGGRLVMIGDYGVADRGVRGALALGRTLLAWPFATMPWWKSVNMLKQNRAVAGLNLLSWWDAESVGRPPSTALIPRLIAPIMDLLSEDAIRPVVHASLPFEQAAEAHIMLHNRRNVGKVVLTP